MKQRREGSLVVTILACVVLGWGAAPARAEPTIEMPGDAPPAPPPQPPAEAADAGAPPAVEVVPSPPTPHSPAPVIAPPPAPVNPPAAPNNAAAPGSVASEPASAGSTVIGGYGQMDLKFLRTGFGNDFVGRANVRRIVLLVAHQWTDEIRSYVEFEWESAVACASCQGVAEVEQAYVDASLFGPDLKLRAGLILVPMGIINRYHEPPVFFSVDRPSFDQSIIPSTWRELGVGLVGRWHDIWHGELYLMTGLDPTHLGPDGIVGGRSSGVLAPVRTGALVGRVEVEPMLGTIVGASGYAADMGPNGEFYDSSGARVWPHIPLFGWSFDARARRAGFELRLVAAQFFMPRSGALMSLHRSDGSLYYPDPTSTGAVPNRTQGAYAELGYDLFRVLWPRTSAQLLAFARVEHYDTQAAVPFPFRAQGQFAVNELTAGLSFLPIRQVVAKADFQLRDRRYGLDELGINFGIGWLF